MPGTFQAFDQFFNAVIAETRRQSKFARTHGERFAARRDSGQSQSQKAIHCLFERTAGFTHLFFEETRYVVVN